MHMTPPVHATKRGVNSLGGQCHGGEHVGFIVRHSPTPRSSEQAPRCAPAVHNNPWWPARVSKPGAGDRFGPELPPGLRAPRTAPGRPRAFTGRPETRRSHRSRSRRKSAYWECCRSSDSAISRPCHRVRKSRRRTPPSGRLSPAGIGNSAGNATLFAISKPGASTVCASDGWANDSKRIHV